MDPRSPTVSSGQLFLLSAENTGDSTQGSFISSLFTSECPYSHPLFFFLRKMWFSISSFLFSILIPFLPPDPCFIFNPMAHFDLLVSSSHLELYQMYFSSTLVKIHFQFLMERLLETEPRTLRKFIFFLVNKCLKVMLYAYRPVFFWGTQLNIFCLSLWLGRAI